MKLEKVNDHQIRCTLTKADLADRQLKLSELAYGTDKAKALFRDMMQQASYELGFEAEDIPLMIEAIPLSSESIILIITKVEDPDELDTRFANFAPSIHDNEDGDLDDMIESTFRDDPDLLNMFKKIKKEITQNPELLKAPAEKPSNEPKSQAKEEYSKAFCFEDLEQVITAAKVVGKFFEGTSSLYRNEQANNLVLIVNMDGHTPEEFNRVCNVLLEYGTMVHCFDATEAYLEEHDACIIADCAIETLNV